MNSKEEILKHRKGIIEVFMSFDTNSVEKWETIKDDDLGITFTKHHTIFNNMLFFIPIRFKSFFKQRNIGVCVLISVSERIECEIPLNILEFFKVFWNVHKVYKKLKQQRELDEYKDIFGVNK